MVFKTTAISRSAIPPHNKLRSPLLIYSLKILKQKIPHALRVRVSPCIFAVPRRYRRAVRAAAVQIVWKIHVPQEGSMTTITLRLDPETRQKLEVLAKATGWRRADLVAEAVRRFVDAEYAALLEAQTDSEEREKDESPPKPRVWKITV